MLTFLKVLFCIALILGFFFLVVFIFLIAVGEGEELIENFRNFWKYLRKGEKNGD